MLTLWMLQQILNQRRKVCRDSVRKQQGSAKRLVCERLGMVVLTLGHELEEGWIHAMLLCQLPASTSPLVEVRLCSDLQQHGVLTP